MAWKKVAKDTVALLSAEAGRNAYDRRLSRGTSREGVRSADRQRSRNVVGVYQLGRERGGHGQRTKARSVLGKAGGRRASAFGRTRCDHLRNGTARGCRTVRDDGRRWPHHLRLADNMDGEEDRSCDRGTDREESIAMWVHASRVAQGLEDKIADREVIAQVVALLAPASRLRPSIYQIATVYTWPRSAPDIPSRGLSQAG
jgi:hypothetical protein